MSRAAHQLGQLRHLDLLALCFETGAITAGTAEVHLAQAPKEMLIDHLTTPWALATLRYRLSRAEAGHL